MGGPGQHCYDVCRAYQRLYRKKGPTGLDDFFHSQGVLVFYRSDLAEQPDHTNGAAVIQGTGNVAVSQPANGHHFIGSALYSPAMAWVPADLEYRYYLQGIRRRPVPVYYRGAACGARGGWIDRAVCHADKGVCLEGPQL